MKKTEDRIAVKPKSADKLIGRRNYDSETIYMGSSPLFFHSLVTDSHGLFYHL